MSPGPYGQRTHKFFSLHYSGGDLTNAAKLSLPPQNITSLQVRGRAGDGNVYRVGLSGANNVFGSFVVVGSPLKYETHFFRRLVGQMEKKYGAGTQPFVYALNENRQTALIPIRKPAALADLSILRGLLKSELSMNDLVFDLYFDGLEKRPRTNVSGEVHVRWYALELHDDSLEKPNEPVRQAYYTRTYLDEKG